MKVISNSPAFLHVNFPVGFKFYHPLYKVWCIVSHHAFNKNCGHLPCFNQSENRKCDGGVVYCSEINNNTISSPHEMCWSLYEILQDKIVSHDIST